ncbi:hypothetical protein JTE90_016497 [Oedothorax gibbosus]|uniref:BTB domain-containing protein n=1 Tax=Oedothorax gibbosus TaxID=931172 RepID=A0AAV6U9A3_9ARAC|nr:hypothetical protein JTE90_016497 [Oedothorax gibbosus]
MAQILGQIRNLLGRIRSCLRNNIDQDDYKGQDAYSYENRADNKNQKVNLTSYRVLGDNFEKIDPKYEVDSKPEHLRSSSHDKVADFKSEDDKEDSVTDVSPQEITSTGNSSDGFENINPSEAQNVINHIKEECPEECKPDNSDASSDDKDYPTKVSSGRMIERDSQLKKESPESIQDMVPSSDEEPLHLMDILEDVTINEIPSFLSFIQRTELYPDVVVVKLGKDNEFHINNKILVNYSGYFNERLQFNTEKRCVLKVKEQCVDPTAFECVLNFLCSKRPITCHNLTAEIIRTATYLEVDPVISKIQSIVRNKEDIVEYALAKFSLIEQIRSHLENSPAVENPVRKARVIVKGQKCNLKAKHLKKLADFAYIEKQMESFFYRSILGKNLNANLFEQLATRPHVVVENSENLTLWLFNVFKHNFKATLFIDSEIYLESMNISLQLCSQFLAVRLEQVALASDYLMLSKAQIKRILEEDIVGARSELVVYLAAVKWTIFKFKARKQSARELFGCVRFGQMSNKEIMALYQPPLLEVMLRAPEIHELIDEATNEPESSSKDPNFKERTLLLKGQAF